MKTKIFATVVIMIFATGCTTTTTARRHFDDITLPSGMAYQADDSVVIESPNLKAAHLVYRGRLEPVTLGDAMRTRLEASGWRQVSRTNTMKDGMRQVYEKDGNAMEVHINEGLWYTYLVINASEVVQQAPVQTGSDTPPASVATGIDPKAVGQAGTVLSDATGTADAPPAGRPAKEPTFTQRVKEFFTNLFTW
ncbi:MAG TPA: hypothetical protein VJZ73_20900 [Methylomirabilota bacterium]|nr:hypothetical protein [Methylomirabilota bacterium]